MTIDAHSERVVLLDESGVSIGTAAKAYVHHAKTPLHLAFSCYVFNADSDVLVTRRALRKRTWPGVWTNSCCGHPAPGEASRDAVARRLHEELGLVAEKLLLVLPGFRYRAEMASGITENEVCPVFCAWSDADPHVNPAETAAFRWVSWRSFADAVVRGELAVSPWCQAQVLELATLGPDPRSWPDARDDELPLAARAR